MNILPFSLPNADTVEAHGVTSTSSAESIIGSGIQMIFMNGGAQACFVAVGGATVEATVNCALIHGNSTRVFTVPPTATHIAAITATGTTTLYHARGEGG